MTRRAVGACALVLAALVLAGAWWTARTDSPDSPETPSAVAPPPAPRAELVGDSGDVELAPREDAVAPAPEGPPSPAEQDPWTIRVQVRRVPDGEPVPAEVLLLGSTPEAVPIPREEHMEYGRLGLTERIVAQKRTNHGGYVLFRDVVLGDYRVVLRPSSLLRGAVLPWDQDRESVESELVFLDATHRTAWVTLHVEHGGVVFGTVFGPDGSPVPGAYVRAGLAEMTVGRPQVSTRTGTDGTYVLDLVPGNYTISPYSPFARAYSVGGGTPPPPATITVASSSSIQADFFFVTGDRSVRGVVVDQGGRPVNALTVLAHYCASDGAGGGDCLSGNLVQLTRTAADGSFELVGLHPARTLIVFGSDQEILAPWPESIVLDLSEGGPVTDLGPVVRQRSDRFCVEGTIVVVLEPLETAGVEVDDLEFRVEDEASGEPLLGGFAVEGLDTDDPIARMGTLRWSCEPGQGPVVLSVRSELGVVERRLVPTPATTAVVELFYP